MTAFASSETILLVAPGPGAAACAQELARQLGCAVDLASARREAAAALRRQDYSILVMDETLARFDPDPTELVVDETGTAFPVQINFALAGTARVVSEVRLAMERRSRQMASAQRAAAKQLEGEVISALTGMLVDVDLLLTGTLEAGQRERAVHLQGLAEGLRDRLASFDTVQAMPRLPLRKMFGASARAV